MKAVANLMHIFVSMYLTIFLFIIYAHVFNVSYNCLGGAATSTSTGKYSSCCFYWCTIMNFKREVRKYGLT